MGQSVSVDEHSRTNQLLEFIRESQGTRFSCLPSEIRGEIAKYAMHARLISHDFEWHATSDKLHLPSPYNHFATSDVMPDSNSKRLDDVHYVAWSRNLNKFVVYNVAKMSEHTWRPSITQPMHEVHVAPIPHSTHVLFYRTKGMALEGETWDVQAQKKISDMHIPFHSNVSEGAVVAPWDSNLLLIPDDHHSIHAVNRATNTLLKKLGPVARTDCFTPLKALVLRRPGGVTLRLVTYYGCVWDYDTGHTVFIHLPDPDDSHPIFKCTKVKDILATDADKAKAISSGHEQLWLVHSSGAKRVSLSEGEEAVSISVRASVRVSGSKLVHFAEGAFGELAIHDLASRTPADVVRRITLFKVPDAPGDAVPVIFGIKVAGPLLCVHAALEREWNVFILNSHTLELLHKLPSPKSVNFDRFVLLLNSAPEPILVGTSSGEEWADGICQWRFRHRK